MRGNNMCDGAHAPVCAFSSCLPQCISLSDIIQSIFRTMHRWLKVSISRLELESLAKEFGVYHSNTADISPRVHKHTHVYIEPLPDRRIPTHGQLWT